MAELIFSVNGQSLSVKSDIEKIVENSILYLYYQIDYSNWRRELLNNEKIIEKYPDGDFPLEVVPIFTFDGKEVKGSAARGFVPIEVIKAPGFTVHLVGTIADVVEGEEVEPIIIPTHKTAVKVHSTGSLDADGAGGIPTIKPTWADNLEVAITGNYTKIEELEDKVDDFIDATTQSYETVGDSISKINSDLSGFIETTKQSYNTMKDSIDKTNTDLSDFISNTELSYDTMKDSIDKTNTELSDFISNTELSYKELNTSLSSTTKDLQDFKKEVNINGTLKRIENLEKNLSNLDLETEKSFIETNNRIEEVNTQMITDYVSKEYFWQEINNLKDDIEEISELVGGE